MRCRRLILAAPCCAFLLLTGGESKAQVIGAASYCVNCATEWTQLLNHAHQIMQYEAQAQTLLRIIQQGQMMEREAVNLATHPSLNIISDLSQLSTLAIQSQGLAGSMANMDARFRADFAPYGQSQAVPNFASAYNKWSSTTLKTLNGSLNAAGYQGQMLQNEALWTQQINALNQTATGRNELLQLSNGVAIAEVGQLQALRQLMIADMTAKSAVAAHAINVEAAQQSSLHNTFGYGKPVVSGKGW